MQRIFWLQVLCASAAWPTVVDGQAFDYPFSCIDSSNNFVTAAVAPNGLVVLVPSTADCVGTVDAVTATFTCVDISSTASGSTKFQGAAIASNGLVIFAPKNANCVGTFDAATSVFNCIDISSTLSGTSKFKTVTTAPNGLVVLIP